MTLKSLLFDDHRTKKQKRRTPTTATASRKYFNFDLCFDPALTSALTCIFERKTPTFQLT